MYERDFDGSSPAYGVLAITTHHLPEHSVASLALQLLPERACVSVML